MLKLFFSKFLIYTTVISSLHPITEEHYKQLLMQWKKNNDCIKDKMNQLGNAKESTGDEGEF